jgi:hypothetical protein
MGTLRRLLPYSSILVVLALCCSVWTLVSRQKADRAREQAAEAEKVASDRKIVQAYGDGNLKILSFYANPPAVKNGEKALLCYGVANARSVSIQPQVGAVTPSLSRCVDVRPRATTEYSLTAQDASGKSDTRSVAVRVR